MSSGRFFFFLLAAVIGSGCGWVLERTLHSTQTITLKDSESDKAQSGSLSGAEDAEQPAVEDFKGKKPTIKEIASADISTRTPLLLEYLSNASIGEIQDLYREMTTRRDAYLDYHDLNLVILRATELDARGFATWLGEFESESREPYFFSNLPLVYRAWAQLDPDMAIEACDHESVYSKKEVLDVLADVDHQRAVDLARNRWPETNALKDLERKRMELLAKQDPSKALAETKSIANRESRRQARRNIVLHSDDTETTWKWFKESGVRSPEIGRYLFGKMADQDPRLARQRLAELDAAEDRRHQWEAVIARSWAKQNLEATIGWIQNEPDPAQRRLLLANIAEELGNRNPAKLLDLMLENNLVDTRTGVDTARVYSRNSSRTISLGRTSVSNPARKAVLELAKKDPASAFAYANLLQLETSVISTMWAKQNPPEAASLAAGLPQRTGQDRLLHHAMMGWIQTDPDAATAFAVEKNLPLDGKAEWQTTVRNRLQGESDN